MTPAVETGDLYRLYDGEGRLLYVGMSRVSVTARLSDKHRRRSWWASVARVEIQKVPLDELAERESAAIRAESPIYNITGAINPSPEAIASSRAEQSEHAEYQRKWRASKGARTGEPGRPVTAPCGTVSAYKRHKRNGEPVDDACRDAYNAAQRELYLRRKGRR